MEEIKVILVDEKDNAIGEMEKIAAHKDAKLHRAISVFLFNSNGEMLIQQRAANKYHSPSLWTNTACTHPYPGETTIAAAKRRLEEEMGISASLKKVFDFIYKEQLDDEMTEYELDHVFVGYTDQLPKPNPSEVADYCYQSKEDLLKAIENEPEKYTFWFKKIVNRVYDYIV